MGDVADARCDVGVQGASFDEDGMGARMNGLHMDGMHGTFDYALEVVLHRRLLHRCDGEIGVFVYVWLLCCARGGG